MPQRSRTIVFCTSILHSLVSAQLNVPSPQVLLQGRFGGAQGAQSSYAATPLLFSWPASAVFATFVGDSVTATLTAQAPTVTSNAYCRFAFNIDERQADIKSVTINKRTIQWSATGLSPGKHNLVIIKLTEASYCQVNLEALSAPGGMFLPPELPSAFQSGRRIMFIGDSYTVGYANKGGTNSCSMTACNPVTKSCGPELDSQNAAIAWGPLTAANFNADYQVIAWSGSGLVAYARSQLMLRDSPEVPRSVACSIYPTAVDLFGRQVAADSSSVVSNYSSWVPQVVVLAGGTNDFIPGFQPLPIDEWRSQVLEFIDTINSRYGNPDIIIQVFPSKLLEQGVLLEDEAATYLRYMTSLYNQTQSEGRKNIYLLKLNADDMPFDNWCASHPSAAADANIAAQLSSFINARLPNWTVST